MAYSKTTWVNNETKLNAANMNKIENGIETNSNNMPNGINVDSNNYLILEHDEVEINAQTKKVAYPFTKSGNSLYLDFVQNKGEDNETHLEIAPDFNNGYFNFRYILNGYGVGTGKLDLHYGQNTEIFTNYNTKQIFGNDLAGNGDITIYRHQLTLVSASNTYIGIILSRSNRKINSTSILTSVTGASSSNNYLFLAVRVTGDTSAQYAVGIGYSNGKWATTVSDEIKSVSDSVTPL